MNQMQTEQSDLAGLARRLQPFVERSAPPSYMRGKTFVRDLVMDMVRCSALAAEQIVDQLEGRALLVFDPVPEPTFPDLGRWRVIGMTY
jgi:hypothetical protein